jgi:hypothetical protein
VRRLIQSGKIFVASLVGARQTLGERDFEVRVRAMHAARSVLRMVFLARQFLANVHFDAVHKEPLERQALLVHRVATRAVKAKLNHRCTEKKNKTKKKKKKKKKNKKFLL